MADGETYDRTNTDVSYERLRDDLVHEANRLKAEVVTLAILLEREREKRRRPAWSWLELFRELLAEQLGHRNHVDTHAEWYVASRR